MRAPGPASESCVSSHGDVAKVRGNPSLIGDVTESTPAPPRRAILEAADTLSTGGVA